VPALFLNLDVVLALTSIGTLFAFVMVCAGILVLNQMPEKPESKFKVPFISGKYIVPILFITAVTLTLMYAPGHYSSIFSLEKFPMLLFWLLAATVAVLAFLKNLSLLPILGLISCFYLMAQEHHSNWMRFLVWLGAGLVIYFLYSYRHSKLAQRNKA